MSLEIAVAALLLSLANGLFTITHHSELHSLRKGFLKLARHTKYEG